MYIPYPYAQWSLYQNGNGYVDELLYFVDQISKINSRGIKQKRVAAITDGAIYNIKAEKNGDLEIKRRIPLEAIDMVTKSSVSGLFILHVPNEYDYTFEAAVEKRDLLILILQKLSPSIRVQVSQESDIQKYALKKENSVDRKSDAGESIPALSRSLNLKKSKEHGAYANALVTLLNREERICKDLFNIFEGVLYGLHPRKSPASQLNLTGGGDAWKVLIQRAPVLKKVYESFIEEWPVCMRELKNLMKKTFVQKYINRKKTRFPLLNLESLMLRPLEHCSRYEIELKALVISNQVTLQQKNTARAALEVVAKLAARCNQILKREYGQRRQQRK
eukprot:jgi/Bigna1/144115/aug1.84_g18823